MPKHRELFLQVSTKLCGDPKLRACALSVGEKKHTMIGHLIQFWTWVFDKEVRDGYVTLNPRLLAACMEYDGDADAMMGAMLEWDWLLPGKEAGVFYVNGWGRYSEMYAKRDADAQRKHRGRMEAAERRKQAAEKRIAEAEARKSLRLSKSSRNVSAKPSKRGCGGILRVGRTVETDLAQIADLTEQNASEGVRRTAPVRSYIGAAAVPPALSEAEIAAVEDDLLGGPSAPPKEIQKESSPASHPMQPAPSEEPTVPVAATEDEAVDDGIDLSWMDQESAASFRATLAKAKARAEEEAAKKAQIADLTEQNAHTGVQANPAPVDAFTRPKLAIVPTTRGNPSHKPSWSEMLGANIAYRPEYKQLFQRVAPTWGEIDVALKAWVDKYPGGKRPNLKYIVMCVETARELASKPAPTVVPPGYREELRRIGLDTELGDCPEHLAKRLVEREATLQTVRSVAERSSEWMRVVTTVTSRHGPISVNRGRQSQLEAAGDNIPGL